MQRHYCRTCGADVLNTAICNNCGCKPDQGTAYCYYCGSTTMEHAIICVKCGAGLRKRYSSILLALTIAGLVATITVTGYFVYQAGRNSAAPSGKDIYQSMLQRQVDSLKKIQQDKLLTTVPAVQPDNTAPKKDTVPKKLILNVFSRNEIKQYEGGCLFSAKNGNKNSIIFIDNRTSGNIRINRVLYVVKLQTRDSAKGIVSFSGDPYNIRLSTEHLNKVTSGWEGIGTISVTDKNTGAEIHHRVFSSCNQ